MTREDALAYAAGVFGRVGAEMLSDGDYEVSTQSGSQEMTVRVVRRRGPDFAKLVIDAAPEPVGNQKRSDAQTPDFKPGMDHS